MRRFDDILGVAFAFPLIVFWCCCGCGGCGCWRDIIDGIHRKCGIWYGVDGEEVDVECERAADGEC